MLDLAPIPVLFWTIPVIVVIVPGVVSGATLQYLGSSDPWATVSLMTTLMMSVMQGLLSYAALRAVANALLTESGNIDMNRNSVRELQQFAEESAKTQKKMQDKT